MDNKQIWSRAIIHVDMNAFFASIEQLDFPQLRDLPVAVTNGKEGNCIITCSYEARAYGIHTGMRLKQAKTLCPHLIQRVARPQRYTQISKMIMLKLIDITPDIEVFSVDEAFLDITHCQKYYPSPEFVGRLTQQKIWEACKLPCSVGVSGDKTTAKVASQRHKPQGFTVVPPWEVKDYLRNIPVQQLCGIGKGIAAFLAARGIHYCGDMQKIPSSILNKRFGTLGKRIWLMCQGLDPQPVKLIQQDPKSMGHGKVIPPNTKDKKILLIYFQHMSEKLAARLRRYNMQATHFYLGLRSYQTETIWNKPYLAEASNDGLTLFNMTRHFVEHHWRGNTVSHVQITALDPHLMNIQLNLFDATNHRKQQLNKTIDTINQHYGQFTVAPASLLLRTKSADVIPPSWQPDGVKQTIED